MAHRIEDATDGALDACQLMDGKVDPIRFRADLDEGSEAALKAAFLKSGVVEKGVIAPEYVDAAVTAVSNTFDGIGAMSGLARQDRLLLALRAVLKETAADCGRVSPDDPQIGTLAHDIRRHYPPAE